MFKEAERLHKAEIVDHRINCQQIFFATVVFFLAIVLSLNDYLARCVYIYPAPGRYRERGIVFARFLCIFVSLYFCIFVSLSARLREKGWTDLHEIFREGVE